MPSQVVYKRNKKAASAVLGVILVLLLVCLIIINLALSYLANMVGIERGLLGVLLNLLILVAFGLGAIYYHYSMSKLALYVSDDSFVVQNMFSKKRYALSNLTSVEVKQGPIGNKYNFGTLVANFNSSELPLTIHMLENPQNLSREVKRMSKISSQTVQVKSNLE